jgi:thermosome
MVGQKGGGPSVLSEGTQRFRGREAQRMNIMAATIIADSIKTTLGPRGMDKMLIDSLKDVVITNDGATILREMDVDHPIAKMLVEVARTQEMMVADGTTTAVMIAGELLKKADDLLDKDIHPTIIADGYKCAFKQAQMVLERISIDVTPDDDEMLIKVATTSMTGKGIEDAKEHLAKIVVKVVKSLKNLYDDSITIWDEYIKIVEKEGGTLEQTELINGVILEKGRAHQSMPSRIKDAGIVLANFGLEINDKELVAQTHVDDFNNLKLFLEERKKAVLKMIEKIVGIGAKVFFTRKNIDDFAQYYLAKAGIMAVRRVKKSDLEKLAKATGANLMSNQEEFDTDDLGYAGIVEEMKVGNDVMIFVSNCKNPKSVSILLRAETKHIVEEAGRSFEDSIGTVAAVLDDKKIVAGGGAAEIAISKQLDVYARSVSGREQLAIKAFADALESIPRTLAENAGFNVIDKILELKAENGHNGPLMGLDVFDGKVKDMVAHGVVEPIRIKKVAMDLATQVAIRILRIDDVIAAARLKKPALGEMSSQAAQQEA